MKWQKIRDYSQKAGKEMLAVAEAAYLTTKDPNLSLAHKTLLLGSLVYLLSPIDAIPDLLPGGYADDMSVLLTSLWSVGSVGKEHLKNCRAKQGLIKDLKDKDGTSEKTTTES